MSKEIDLIKCIISEIDDNLYSDFGGNPCIRYTSNLKKLLLALDTPEVRHFFENCNNQAQQIAEIESKLAEKEPYLYDEGGDPLSKKDVADLLNRQNNEITKLENELLEKDELLMKKICDMKSTDVIKILKRYGFLVQAKEIDNQTAIAELGKVKEIVLKEVERVEKIYTDRFQSGFNCCYVFMKEQIDQQIKSLKGKK